MKKLLSMLLVTILLLTCVCACESKSEDTASDEYEVITEVIEVPTSTDTVSSEKEESAAEKTSTPSTVSSKPTSSKTTSSKKTKPQKEENKKPDPDKAVRERMRAGINLTKMNGTGMTDDLSLYIYQQEYYDIIAKAGFNNIRFPVSISDMIVPGSKNYKLDKEHLKRLDIVINNALNAGLIICIDNHFGLDYTDKEQFVAGWRQIAEYYKDYPSELIFELVNEPSDHPDSLLNANQMAAVAAIRKTNPTRNIVLAPNQWNGSWKLWDTEIPATMVNGKRVFDQNVILAVHMYRPYDFTHQGENREGAHISSTSDISAAVLDVLEICADYEERTGRTVWINEWGVFQTHGDDQCMPMYYKYVTNQLAKHDLAYAVWEFNCGYGIFDMSKKKFKDYIIDNMKLTW